MGPPLGLRKQRIDRLISVAPIESHLSCDLQVTCRAPQKIAVGPDSTDRDNRSTGQQDSERNGVCVRRDSGLGLAPGLPIVFDQVGRPDHGSSRPHPAELERDWCPIARSLNRKILKARAPRASAADDGIIDLAPRQSSDRPTQWAAERGADRG